MNTINSYKEIIQSRLFLDGPIVIFIWENTDGWPVVDVSSNIELLYGYSPELYKTGKIAFAEQIHPDDMAQVFSEVTIASSSTQNSFSHKPYRYQASNGDYHWVSDNTTILRDDKGIITHYVGYLTDITDSVNTQSMLEEKERWFENLFKISPVGISINKITGEFVQINSALHNMCGYTHDEFINLSYWDITPVSYQDQEEKQLHDIHTIGRYGPYKKEYIHKDGHHINVLLNGIVATNSLSEKFIFSIIQDITELTKANEEAQQSNKNYRTLYEKANDGIFIIRDGVFTQCNPKLLNMIQMQESEIVGLSPNKISPEKQADGMDSKEKAIMFITKAIEGEPQVFEWEHLKGDGSPLNVEVSLSFIEDANDSYLLGFWRDITERIATRKRLEEVSENLRIEKEKAEFANHAKSRFLANMSHEIRTPMNGILGFINILEKNETDENRKNHFRHIQSSSQLLLSVINDILDLSKLESGKLEMELSPVNTKDLFDGVIGIYQSICHDKGLTFEYKISNTLPAVLTTDIVRIKQVVINLLSNAVKFTSKDGKVSLDVSYDTKKSILSCSVSDTGVGIESKNIDKIFKAFEQEDTSTTRKYGGTGLGLAICSSIVNMLGGKVNVSSEINKGSTFSFSIPVSISEISTIIEDETATNDNEKKTIDAKILIVEDNPTNQMLLSLYIDDMNLEYDIAADGLEAIEHFKNHDYDMILMDENMPNMNGIDATKHIRTLEQSKGLEPIIIVAVTANAISGDRERFIDAGMDDYISKPYSDTDIEKIIHKYFG